MEIILFAFFFLKFILASEGAGTATGEAKINFCKTLYPCFRLEYLDLKSCKSFTCSKGGVIIQEDDHYER